MGNILGKQIRSSSKRTLDPAAAAQVISIKEKEAAQAAVLQATLQQGPPPDAELPDKGGEQMRRLIRAIESGPVDLYKDSKDVKFMKLRRVTKEQKEAALVGRLETAQLRNLLEENLRAKQEGKQLDVGELARKYGADEALLRRTLAHSAMVPVEKAADGRLVAETAWPAATKKP